MSKQEPAASRPEDEHPPLPHFDPNPEPVDGVDLRERVRRAYAPSGAKLDTPAAVKEFRAKCEEECNMCCVSSRMVAGSTKKLLLLARAEQHTDKLNKALYKLGMLGAVLKCLDRSIGETWISESLPVIRENPLTRPLLSYYLLSAACFFGEVDKWEECENYARQAVKALPSNKQKLLLSPEAYRIVAVALLMREKFTECGVMLDRAIRLANAQRGYWPALWGRMYQTKEHFHLALDECQKAEKWQLRRIAQLSLEAPEALCQRQAERRLAWNIQA